MTKFSTAGGTRAAASTDGDLIAASLTEPELFAGVFDRHYTSIAGFLRRRLDRSLADELAAEAFTRAFDGRSRYDLAWTDARPWLFGIAAKLISEHRRSEERRLRAFARAAAPAPGDEFDEVDARVDASAASAGLASALASLPAGDRDVLLLHAWAELSYQQISDALGIPVGTVRSRLHRARELAGRELTRAMLESRLEPRRHRRGVR